MRNLDASERETIILFNETSEPAEIFTYNKSWQQHLEKKVGLKPIKNNGYGGKTYQIDKKRIKPPRAKVKLSAEARQKAGSRLAIARSQLSKLVKLL